MSVPPFFSSMMVESQVFPIRSVKTSTSAMASAADFRVGRGERPLQNREHFAIHAVTRTHGTLFQLLLTVLSCVVSTALSQSRQ